MGICGGVGGGTNAPILSQLAEPEERALVIAWQASLEGSIAAFGPVIFTTLNDLLATIQLATTFATHHKVVALPRRTQLRLGQLLCSPRVCLGLCAARCIHLCTTSTHATWRGFSNGGARRPQGKVLVGL